MSFMRQVYSRPEFPTAGADDRPTQARILLTAFVRAAPKIGQHEVLRSLSIGDDFSPTNLVGMTPGPFLNALSQRAFWLARNGLHGAHVLFYERDKCACFGAGEAARWVNGG